MPATVPPAMAPVLDFEGGGCEVVGEVAFVEVGGVEAGVGRVSWGDWRGFRGRGGDTVCEMRALEKCCDLWDEVFQIASATIIQLSVFWSVCCMPTYCCACA